MSKIGQAVVALIDEGHTMEEITNGQVELVTV